jgi:hypothetical protein
VTRFRADRPPDGPYEEVGRWHLVGLGDLRSLRLGLRTQLVTTARDQDSVADGLPDRLLLVANELASNALRHGSGDAVVVLARGSEGWLVDVSDLAVHAEPVPAVDRTPGLGGYGLHLVAELAADSGWYRDGSRKHVWSRLADPPPDAPPPQASLREAPPSRA